MRKHDEGYTLLLVIVVILVLSILSAALMSMTLGNLKSQRASVNRMTEKYSAQGELEKLVATIENELRSNSANEIQVDQQEITLDPENEELQYLQLAVSKWFGETAVEGLSVDEETTSFTCVLPVTASTEKTTVACELIISGTVKEVEKETEEGQDPSGGADVTEHTRTFAVTFQKLTYKSYEISASNEGGGD